MCAVSTGYFRIKSPSENVQIILHLTHVNGLAFNRSPNSIYLDSTCPVLTARYLCSTSFLFDFLTTNLIYIGDDTVVSVIMFHCIILVDLYR